MFSVLFMFAPVALGSSFTEDFGTTQSTCGSAWYDDCEVGWTQVAGNDKLAMCTDGEDPPEEWGVGIHGDAGYNGFRRTSHVLGANKELLSWTAKLIVLAGSGNAQIRMVIKDSGGVALDSQSYAISVNTTTETYWLNIVRSVPDDAYSVDLVVGGNATNLDIYIDELAFLEEDETGGDEKTQAECDTYAEDATDRRETECENDGGTFGGSCTSSPDDSMPLGCDLVCLTTCITPVTPTAPAEVQCPGGW